MFKLYKIAFIYSWLNFFPQNTKRHLVSLSTPSPTSNENKTQSNKTKQQAQNIFMYIYNLREISFNQFGAKFKVMN